jgi:hypothetical protein
MGIHPDVLRERDAGFTWWRPAGTGIKIDRSTITKTRDSPEFAVGLGAMEFRNGLHEFEFFVTRNSEGYVYVGVAHPDIPTDKTFCRRDAKDQVYFLFHHVPRLFHEMNFLRYGITLAAATQMHCATAGMMS